MGHIQSIHDLIAFVGRRIWFVAAIAVIGAILSIAYAKSRPDTWEAAAVIQIEAPEVDQGAAVATDAQGRSTAELLQSVEQRLTSRENMLAVIERHRLFADLPSLSPDQKIAILRQSVTFQRVASAGQNPYAPPTQVSAMIISARFGDPEQAARVANDFAQGLLDESTANQAARARETLSFYQEEVRRIEADMAALDAELTAYRGAHADSLPAAREALQTEASGLDSDLRDVERDLIGLQGEQALVREQGMTRATDQRRMDELEARISVLTAQRDALSERRTQIRQTVADAGQVDQMLGIYDRRARQLQAQHEVASRRLAEADAASRLTDRRQTERISLLERAMTPETPITGGGKKIVIAGTLASLMAGLGLAFLGELLRPVVRTADQMERELDLRPVISIPELHPQTRRRGGVARLIDDPTKPVLGLPRFAVLAVGTTVALLAVAAVIG